MPPLRQAATTLAATRRQRTANWQSGDNEVARPVKPLEQGLKYFFKMDKIFNVENAVAIIGCGAVEAETIKNTVIPKNHKSRKFYYSLVLLLPFLFSSCATIFCGTKQKITVTGNVDVPVQLLVDGRIYSDKDLPTKVKIKRRPQPSSIVAFAPNYNIEEVKLRKSFNWVVLIHPLYSWVDFATGAWRKSKVKSVDFNFTPTKSNKEASMAYFDFGMKHYNVNQRQMALSYFQKAYEIDIDNDFALQKIHDINNYFDYLEEQARLKAERRAERAERAAIILTAIGGALSTTADVMETIQPKQNSGGNTSSGSTNSGSSTSKSTNTSNSTTKADCGDAWRTDSRTYSWYDDELVKMQTSPEKYDNYASKVSEIQSKMRQIRQKWESRGCKITKSPRE